MKYHTLIFTLAAALFVVDARAIEVRIEPPNETVRRIVAPAVTTTLRCDSAALRLTRLLVDSGYLSATAACDSTGEVVVNAGEPSLLLAIDVTGDSVYTIRTESKFTQAALTALVDEHVLRPLQTKGYYFSQASVVDVRQDGTSVAVTIRLARGPVVTFGDFTFEGLRRTRPALVSKYLRVPAGVPLTDDVIARVEARARAIPFLTCTQSVSLQPHAGYTQANLHVAFREPQQFSLQGSAGYRADDRNGVVWSFDAAVRNMFGDGRQARVVSERRDLDHTTLLIDYRQPVKLFGVSELGAQVSTRDYRDQFYEFGALANWNAHVGDNSTAGVGLSWKRVDPEGVDPAYRRYLVNLTYRISTVVDTVNPDRGTVLDWSVAWVHRKYQVDSLASLNETRARLSAAYHLPLFARFLAVTSVAYVTLETKEELPPISELFLIGGPGSLRGYLTDQFTARRAAVGSAEIRWRGQSGYLFGFCDLAYVNRPVQQSGGVVTDEFARVGYGAGALLLDRGRSVKVAVGWNPGLRFSSPQVLLQVATGL